MRYKSLVIIIIVLLSFSIFFSSIFAENCGYGFVKKDGYCVYFDEDNYVYSIYDQILTTKPVLFGSIKVVGGGYIGLNTTNVNNALIQSPNNYSIDSLSIFNINNSDKNGFVLYPSVNNRFDYFRPYNFFFNLKYQTNPDKNADIVFPFGLNK